MLSNFSWLQYGVFMGVSLLIYYLVLIAWYYRKEVRVLWGSLAKGKIRGTVLAKDQLAVDGGLMGRAIAEEGMTCLGMEELDFGGGEGNGEMLQGQLADCMEELKYAFLEAQQDGWNRKQLGGSLFEIAECYAEVFASSLGHQLREHICSELKAKFDWNIRVSELGTLLAKKEMGSGFGSKVVAGGVAVLAFLAQVVHGQDGNQGIAEATSKVAGYFDTGTDLMYAIGAIMGLVGAVKVYSKWNAGEPDTAKVATAWFGSCIFLVVVATVLKSFFGI